MRSLFCTLHEGCLCVRMGEQDSGRTHYNHRFHQGCFFFRRKGLNMTAGIAERSVTDAVAQLRSCVFPMLRTRRMDQITCRDVLKVSHVSKSGFYYNYHDLEDLVFDCIRTEIDELTKGVRNYQSWTKAYYLILKYFQEHREEIMNIYFSRYHSDFKREVERYGRMVLEDAVNQNCESMHTKLDPDNENFMVDYYYGVFSGLLYRYVEQGMKKDPEKIVRQCYAMMKGSIPASITALSHQTDLSF